MTRYVLSMPPRGLFSQVHEALCLIYCSSMGMRHCILIYDEYAQWNRHVLIEIIWKGPRREGCNTDTVPVSCQRQLGVLWAIMGRGCG